MSLTPAQITLAATALREVSRAIQDISKLMEAETREEQLELQARAEKRMDSALASLRESASDAAE